MQSLAVIFSLVVTSPFCAWEGWKESTAVHLVSLFFLFFSQGGCTHTYIISLPSQTHTHFPCVLLYFNGLAANVCLGLNVVQRYENRSAGFVASSRLQYLFLCGCCPKIWLRKIKKKHQVIVCLWCYWASWQCWPGFLQWSYIEWKLHFLIRFSLICYVFLVNH